MLNFYGGFIVTARKAQVLIVLSIASLLGSQSRLCRAAAVTTIETLGDLQMAEKHYVAAIDYYRTVSSPSAQVLNKIGVAYHHLFGFQMAKAYYQQAISMNPKYAPALNNLGAIFYGEQNYRAAEKLYRQSIKLDPHSAKTYKNLGTAYFAHGKISRGVEQYRAAFALDPQMFLNDDAIAEPTQDDNRAVEYYSLARMFAEAGRDQAAIDYLRKALEAGFTDKKRLMNEMDFAGIRNMPEFRTLALKI
jgi:tetratricopeptide (TPR) repeat protein